MLSTHLRLVQRRLWLLSQRSFSVNIFEAVETQLLSTIPQDRIRNFSVIAHVDHGKSTLSDAILSRTGNISESDRKKGQVLDTLKVERERGITVKANTASMIYHYNNTPYLLNLIDTPGHIDFSYEGNKRSCNFHDHHLHFFISLSVEITSFMPRSPSSC